MGQSVRGLLGLGPDVVTTAGHVVKISLSGNDDEGARVVDIKAGTNHLLALTDDGQVYAWGLNKHGQVGSYDHQELVWSPARIYPEPQNASLLLEDENFDPAIQLAVHEDSSFLLTASGSIYSWGKNDNNFLARDTKFDVRQQMQNKGSASQMPQAGLKFSKMVPQRVTKLEKYKFQRITIKDGKFMGYLVNDLNSYVASFHQEGKDETS